MNRTSDTNPTGVRAYDHVNLAELPEYRAVQQALDNLTRAIRTHETAGPDGQPLTQEQFLTAVADAAAAIGYADMCRACATYDAHYPIHVQVRDGRVVCGYRCPSGHLWTCGWSIDAPAIFGAA